LEDWPVSDEQRQLHVLRLCSVFEPDSGSLSAGAGRFDPIGGMQNHTGALTRSLDGLGVDQTVVTSRQGAAARRIRRGGATVVHRVGLPISRLRQLWALAAVPRVIARRRPVDLVHAHQGEDVATLLLAFVAAAVHRCPLVVTVHCSVGHTVKGRSLRALFLRWVGGAVEQAVLPRALAVVVLTSRMASLLERNGVPAQLLHVVPSGFEPALFAPGRHADEFLDVARPRIGYVGRLAEQKRPEILVEAISLMRHPASLVVVGDGPRADVVSRMVRESLPPDRVVLRGFVEHSQVPAVLASLDVLALPSSYEELGSVLVEAMIAGLPVVATAVGGIPEVVDDGATGLLVPPDDPAAMAAALDRLVSSPAERRRMSEAARHRAASYAWPELSQRILRIYDELAGRSPATRPAGVHDA
jgi:2-deoxystreptamine N-acetyl-D-glucosaminyltransferase/2-deoxystreptamine glucosyltransferase